MALRTALADIVAVGSLTGPSRSLDRDPNRHFELAVTDAGRQPDLFHAPIELPTQGVVIGVLVSDLAVA
jgi:hypothetical protein